LELDNAPDTYSRMSKEPLSDIKEKIG